MIHALMLIFGLSLAHGDTGDSSPEEFVLKAANTKTRLPEDRTLSPYLWVADGDPETDRLPLKSTAVSIKAVGPIAKVSIKQRYKNEGKKNIEAVYVFPMSTKAAVHDMEMRIGERRIKAKIADKKKARAKYKKALSDGKSASLLEQKRPNVFQMQVGNILPKDDIEITLEYTELLVPTENRYQIVFPTVVGPRYSETSAGPESKSEHWIASPYLGAHLGPTSEFSMEVDIVGTGPISRIRSLSHDFDAKYLAKERVSLVNMRGSASRDVIIEYELSSKDIQSGLIRYEGKDENFLLAMIAPPKRISNKDVLSREYIFVMDVSGSMSGYPLDTSKRVMENVIDNLGDTDRFNVIQFAGGSNKFAEKPLRATTDNKRKLKSWIASARGGGGTRLLPALKDALEMPQTNLSKTIVVLTDGYVDVEAATFDLMRKSLGEANLFAFGIGSSVNRHLIEGMARVGMGEAYVVTKSDQASAQADRFAEQVRSPLLTDIKVRFKGFEATEVIPTQVPDLFSQRPILIFGKYKGRAKGAIQIEGKTASGRYKKRLSMRKAKSGEDNSAIRLLWARHKIASIADLHRLNPGNDRDKALTDLGLKYNLMTKNTSFVAVDPMKRTKSTPLVINQPIQSDLDGVQMMGLRGTGYGGGGMGGRGSSGHGVNYKMKTQIDFDMADISISGELHAPQFKSIGSGSNSGTTNLSSAYSLSGRGLAAGSVSRRKAGGKLKEGSPIILGSLDKNLIKTVMKKNTARFRYCYERELTKYPNLAGKLTLKMTIDKKGKVSLASIIDSNLGNDRVESCMIRQAKRLSFPKPKGGGEVVVRFPFILAKD